MKDTVERLYCITGDCRTFGDLPHDEICEKVRRTLKLPVNWFLDVRVYRLVRISTDSHAILVYDSKEEKNRPIVTVSFECTVGLIFDRAKFNRFKLTDVDAYQEVVVMLREYEYQEKELRFMGDHLSKCMSAT